MRYILALIFLQSCSLKSSVVNHHYNNQIKKHPSNPQLHFDKATTNFYQFNNYQETINELNTYISLVPQNTHKLIAAYAIRATSKSFLEQESLTDFLKALSLSKKDTLYQNSKILITKADVLFNLTFAYLNKNDKVNALRAINKAIALNKSDKQYIGRLKEVRGE